MIEPVPDFRDYLSWPSDKLLHRLAEVQWEIAGWQIELHYCRETEARQKASAWLQSGETSVQARDRAAQWSSLEAKVSAAELEAKIASRTEEKFFLIRLLDADRP